jgi:hypothetical protein
MFIIASTVFKKQNNIHHRMLELLKICLLNLKKQVTKE